MRIFDNDDKTTDKRLEQVIEAISKHDKAALKAMFSSKALSGANNFDGSMDYLFDFFQGSVSSYNRDAGPLVDESTDHGDKVKEVKTWYSVNANKQKYLFFLLEYTEDTGHSDNVGLYTLRVIRAEDEKTQFRNWQDMKVPGIYKPDNQK